MATTRLTRHIRAPRGVVYRALLDAEDVQQWMVPEGMTSQIHAFDAREGGEFRISLTYDMPTAAGKTTSQTDSFHGRFVKLVPDNEVVQVIEFETDDPAMKGEMTVTYALGHAARSLVGLPVVGGGRQSLDGHADGWTSDATLGVVTLGAREGEGEVEALDLAGTAILFGAGGGRAGRPRAPKMDGAVSPARSGGSPRWGPRGQIGQAARHRTPTVEIGRRALPRLACFRRGRHRAIPDLAGRGLGRPGGHD